MATTGSELNNHIELTLFFQPAIQLALLFFEIHYPLQTTVIGSHPELYTQTMMPEVSVEFHDS